MHAAQGSRFRSEREGHTKGNCKLRMVSACGISGAAVGAVVPMHQWARWRSAKLVLCVAATIACSCSDQDENDPKPGPLPPAGSGGTGASIVVRIATHPPDDACLGVITPPVGCYPTQPMLATLIVASTTSISAESSDR